MTLVGPGLDQRGALAQLWKPSCELCRGSAGMGEAVQWCRRDQEASQGPAVVQGRVKGLPALRRGPWGTASAENHSGRHLQRIWWHWMQVKCGGAIHHDNGLLGRKHGFGGGGVVQNYIDLGMAASVVRGVTGAHTLGISWNKGQ